jgi:hypothetical protein
VLSFFLGVGGGFLVALLLPQIARAGYMFQVENVQRLLIGGGVKGGLWLVFEIFIRNFSIALLLMVLPILLVSHSLAYRKRYRFNSGDPRLRMRSELQLVLTMYSVAILFAYGFFVFGFHLAFVFVESSIQGLMSSILYLIPHGILETFGIASAASTAIIIKNNWIENLGSESSLSWIRVHKNSYANYLLLLLIILLLSAFLEVYVSLSFMKSLIRVLGF